MTGPSQRLDEIDDAASLNAKIMRHEFRVAPGAFSDSFYAETARRGITVVPLVNLRPMPTTASARSAFVQMAAAHAGRYGPGGSFWKEHPELDGSVAPRVFEVMNEPYIEAQGGPYDPAGFATLLRDSSKAMRVANSQVQIAMPVAASYWGSGGYIPGWIDSLYAAVPDLNAYFDVAAVHPYSQNPDTCDPTARWCFRQLELIRSQLDARGAADKRVWITEIGNNTAGPSARTEEEQALYLQRYVDWSKSYGYVDTLLYYNYRDYCTNLADKECWFGVVRPDGSKKPAFHALREAATANP